MFFMSKLTPTEVTVCGRRVQLLFTMHAAARMEAELETDYPALVLELLQAPLSAESGMRPPMAIARQAVIVRILMEECGQEISQEELEGLHASDFALLARAAQTEILKKSPTEGAKKNAQQTRRT